MNNTKIETSIQKSIICGMFFGAGLVVLLEIVYIIGLYLNLFVPDGHEFLIILFFYLVLFGPVLMESMDIAIQKRQFYIIDDNGITIGSKSLLVTTQETYPLTQNSSIKIRFDNLACFESIELYLFSEKFLIEKSELRSQNYEDIKSALLLKCIKATI